MPTDAEIVKGIQATGPYDATVGSETEARRLLQMAMPNAVELQAAITGQPYPKPPRSCRKWYQLHPAEPGVKRYKPHFKYVDWTQGKKYKGGSWGHIEF